MIFRMMLKTSIERIDDNEENKILSYNFDLFVSYCGDNKDEVYKLCDDLEQEEIWRFGLTKMR